MVASATGCADDANADNIRARGWAPLLLDRHRDFTDYGPRAPRSASGKTDDGTPALPYCLIPHPPSGGAKRKKEKGGNRETF